MNCSQTCQPLSAWACYHESARSQSWNIKNAASKVEIQFTGNAFGIHMLLQLNLGNFCFFGFHHYTILGCPLWVATPGSRCRWHPKLLFRPFGKAIRTPSVSQRDLWRWYTPSLGNYLRLREILKGSSKIVGLDSSIAAIGWPGYWKRHWNPWLHLASNGSGSLVEWFQWRVDFLLRKVFG